MDRYKIEKAYEANGLKDYKLRNTEDLFKIHGIDSKTVDGYEDLDDINRQHYEKGLIALYNGMGLESRAEFIPKGIYYVEDADLLVREKDQDGEEYCIVVGGVIKAIDRYGDMRVLRQWIDNDYAGVDYFKEDPKRYLRIEYEHHGRKEWLHLIPKENGRIDWY